MKVSTHFVIQILLMATSLATMISGQVPVKYQPFIVGLASFLQAVVAWINHYFTPDGTPIPPTQ